MLLLASSRKCGTLHGGGILPAGAGWIWIAETRRLEAGAPSSHCRLFLRQIKPVEQFAQQHNAKTGFGGQNDSRAE